MARKGVSAKTAQRYLNKHIIKKLKEKQQNPSAPGNRSNRPEITYGVAQSARDDVVRLVEQGQATTDSHLSFITPIQRFGLRLSRYKFLKLNDEAEDSDLEDEEKRQKKREEKELEKAKKKQQENDKKYNTTDEENTDDEKGNGTDKAATPPKPKPASITFPKPATSLAPATTPTKLKLNLGPEPSQPTRPLPGQQPYFKCEGEGCTLQSEIWRSSKNSNKYQDCYKNSSATLNFTQQHKWCKFRGHEKPQQDFMRYSKESGMCNKYIIKVIDYPPLPPPPRNPPPRKQDTVPGSPKT